MKNKKVKIGAIIIGILLVVTVSIGFILNNNEKVENSNEIKFSKNIEKDTTKDNNKDLGKEKDTEEEKNSKEIKAEEKVSEDSPVKATSSTNKEEVSKQENKTEANIENNTNTSTVKPGNGSEVKVEPVEKYVTISITCNTILNNLDKVQESKRAIIPSNGVILGEKSIKIDNGDTVFDILLKETRKQRIHMDFVQSPVYESAYIKGINNLYEFDGGELSGWKYSVNGVFPSYGCSNYELNDGDVIEWKYTCDLGKDL